MTFLQSNNGGGFICVAHVRSADFCIPHLIYTNYNVPAVAPSHSKTPIFVQTPPLILILAQIAGPKSTTVPQAGLNTTARAGPLAQLITKALVANPGLDPDVDILYNPLNWFFPQNNTEFTSTFNWLEPPVKKVLNGRADAFSME